MKVTEVIETFYFLKNLFNQCQRYNFVFTLCLITTTVFLTLYFPGGMENSVYSLVNRFRYTLY